MLEIINVMKYCFIFETNISTMQGTTVILKSIQYFILNKYITAISQVVMVPLKPKLLGQPIIDMKRFNCKLFQSYSL